MAPAAARVAAPPSEPRARMATRTIAAARIRNRGGLVGVDGGPPRRAERSEQDGQAGTTWCGLSGNGRHHPGGEVGARLDTVDTHAFVQEPGVPLRGPGQSSPGSPAVPGARSSSARSGSVIARGRRSAVAGAEAEQAAPQVGLDRRHRAAGLGGDLGERQVAEEAQHDDFAVRLVERFDRPAEIAGALDGERRLRPGLPPAEREPPEPAGRVTRPHRPTIEIEAQRGAAGRLPGEWRRGWRSGAATPRTIRSARHDSSER